MNPELQIVEDVPETPSVIKSRLSFQIRRYLAKPTQSLAKAVVQQLEVLLKHPDCIGYPDDRCSYKKMLQQWRALS